MAAILLSSQTHTSAVTHNHNTISFFRAHQRLSTKDKIF